MTEAEIKLYYYEIAVKRMADNAYLDPTATEAFAGHAIFAARQSLYLGGAKPPVKMCHVKDCDMCEFWMSLEPPLTALDL